MWIINRHRYLPLTIGFINLILFFIALISIFIRDSKYNPSLIRWILSFTLPTTLAYSALKKKSVDYTGAIAGILVTISMTLSSYICLISLIICHFATSKATQAGENIKNKFESNFKSGGQRNWIQIVSNLGAANIAILIRFILYGSNEECLDLIYLDNYWNSWLLLSSLMSISAALGDTFSSELGPIFSDPNTDPLLITTLRRVPKGTNGGVTIAGFFAACFGGLMIGVGSYVSIKSMTTSPTYVNNGYLKSTPQWPLLYFCLCSGIIGSILDSFMGAILQYTCFDKRRQRIVEIHDENQPDYFNVQISTNIEYITGRNIFDNHEINLLMTSIMSLIMPTIATVMWPFEFADHY